MLFFNGRLLIHHTGISSLNYSFSRNESWYPLIYKKLRKGAEMAFFMPKHISSEKGRTQKCWTQTWFEVLSIFWSSMNVFKVEETEEVKTFSLLPLRVMCGSLLPGSPRVWPTAWLSLLLGRGVTGLACPHSMLFPASRGQKSALFSMGCRS